MRSDRQSGYPAPEPGVGGLPPVPTGPAPGAGPDSRYTRADQQIRMAALQAAATLIAPALGESAAAFRLESADKIGGGALALAARFEGWIKEGGPSRG